MSFANDFPDLVKVTTSSTGTGGPLTLGSAVAGHRGVSALTTTKVYSYSILRADGEKETCWGIYTSAGTSITRNTIASSTGSALTLIGGEFIQFDFIGRDAINAAPRVGDVLFTTSAPDSSWKKCDGSAYLQSSYADGYAAVGLIADLGPPVSRAPNFDTSSWRDVTFANSVFVAVGDSGAIQSSADGITWTLRTSGVTTNLIGIIYANSLFVAYGAAGVILTSSDGTTWTSRTSNVTHQINKIIYLGTVFVGVGASGDITSSSNGTSWTAGSSGVATDLIDVHYDGTYFAACGASGVIVYVLAASFILSLGMAWSAGTSGVATTLNKILYANSIWVCVGASSVCRTATIPSGTWTSRTLTGGGATPTVLLYANSLFVCGTPGTATWGYSSNGTSWTSFSTTVAAATAIGYLNSVFVGIGGTGSVNVSTTTDPSTVAVSVRVNAWSAANVNTSTQSAPTALAYGASVYVAVGAGGLLMSSADAITWTIRTKGILNNSLSTTQFAYGASVYVGVGSNGIILRSSDLTTWLHSSAHTLVSTLAWVTFGNSLFVAVGGSGVIYTSSDGISWTARTSGVAVSLSCVIYANSLFVATGASGTILTSSDGITWTARTSGVTGTVSTIAYGASKYVAVVGQQALLYSSDGITWSQASLSFSVGLITGAVVFVNSTFIIFASSLGTLVSTNGTSWAFVESPRYISPSSGGAAGTSMAILGGLTIFTTFDGSKIVPVNVTNPGGVNFNSFTNGHFIGGTFSGRITSRPEYSYDTSTYFAVPNIGSIGPSDNPVNAYMKLAA